MNLTEEYAFVSKGGRHYSVTMPRPMRKLRSAYIFAFPKSGSTLLDNMVTSYCSEIGVPTFSLFGQAFNQGIHTHDVMDDARICFHDEGYIYTGFRHFPIFNLDVSRSPKILLTRDPRDMLVSKYFSIVQSHVIPTGLKQLKVSREIASKMSIDEFVIDNARYYPAELERYLAAFSGTDVKIYRYEDVIYNKGEWLKDVISVIGLKYKLGIAKAVAHRFDTVPNVEKEGQHIRKVHPGDHISKLKPETIRQLNVILAKFIQRFDYLG
jgi:hypothetical protein